MCVVVGGWVGEKTEKSYSLKKWFYSKYWPNTTHSWFLLVLTIALGGIFYLHFWMTHSLPSQCSWTSGRNLCKWNYNAPWKNLWWRLTWSDVSVWKESSDLNLGKLHKGDSACMVSRNCLWGRKGTSQRRYMYKTQKSMLLKLHMVLYGMNKSSRGEVRLEQVGVVVQACNPSTWEAKAEGSWVQGQPELHSETLSQ
jgi:hypothetical protein